jgi:hypothetical protein
MHTDAICQADTHGAQTQDPQYATDRIHAAVAAAKRSNVHCSFPAHSYGPWSSLRGHPTVRPRCCPSSSITLSTAAAAAAASNHPQLHLDPNVVTRVQRSILLRRLVSAQLRSSHQQLVAWGLPSVYIVSAVWLSFVHEGGLNAGGPGVAGL